MILRSNFEEGSTRWAVRRAQWFAMGIKEEDFLKPKIAVINSSSSLSVCYIHLDQVSKAVQDAVREAGGLPFEIRTAAPSDFITSAGLKARYILPTRDLVVNDIEVMVEGACLDGMVLLSSCDKTTPAHLMASGRLNIPSIVVPCGYQLGGKCGNREVDIEEVYKAVGTVRTGKMPLSELEDWTRVAIQGPGVCAGLATANSMHILAEALGMALPGTTPVRAGSENLFQFARRAGVHIVEMIEQQILPRQILTREAFQNAVVVAISIGASVNTVRHLAAVATESGLNLDITKLFEHFGSGAVQITRIKPNGEDRIEALDAAGGTRGVMQQMQRSLCLFARNVTGKTLGEVLQDSIQVNEEVIRPMDRPFRPEPGLIILRGNLAPDGAIVKLSAVPGAMRQLTGPARIFEGEDEAIAELGNENIQPGDVVVLRMMGPIGGPGTVFACSFMAALVGAGLESSVAVVTDGELSGLNRGITVGQVMPEAALGGPLAIVREGESIHIDLDKRTINLEVSEEEIQLRCSEWKPLARKLKPGWLSIYAQVVQPLSAGAVLGQREQIDESKLPT